MQHLREWLHRLLGGTVDVDGRPHEILGIMPPGVDILDHRTEIWLPLGVHPAITRIRGTHILSVVGRLRDGVTLDAAQVELDTFLADWQERIGGNANHVPTSRPAVAGDHDLRLQPLHDAWRSARLAQASSASSCGMASFSPWPASSPDWAGRSR